jgi:hypothetical protein
MAYGGSHCANLVNLEVIWRPPVPPWSWETQASQASPAVNKSRKMMERMNFHYDILEENL